SAALISDRCSPCRLMPFCAQLGWFPCREMPGADRQCRGIRANTEQTTPAQPRSLRLLIEMPANDPEAVPHRGLEALAVQAPVGSSWDAHEGHDPWVHVRHHGEQSLYFIDIGYQFGSCEHVAPSQPEPHWTTVLEVQLPVAPAGGQQRAVLPHITDRLPVDLPGLAPGDPGQHQPPGQRSRKGKPQDDPHRNVDYTHEAGLCSPSDGTLRMLRHDYPRLRMARTLRRDALPGSPREPGREPAKSRTAAVTGASFPEANIHPDSMYE